MQRFFLAKEVKMVLPKSGQQKMKFVNIVISRTKKNLFDSDIVVKNDVGLTPAEKEMAQKLEDTGVAEVIVRKCK